MVEGPDSFSAHSPHPVRADSIGCMRLKINFRHKLRVLIAVYGVSLAATPLFADSDTIRCDGSLIEVGTPMEKVLAKCGEPTSRFDGAELTIFHMRYLQRLPSGRFLYDSYSVQYENPVHFLEAQARLSSHEHNDLLDLNSAATEWQSGGRSFRKRLLHPRANLDLSQYGWTWQCRIIQVNKSRWFYNLGPSRFIRILSFRNGQLANIETEGYGY